MSMAGFLFFGFIIISYGVGVWVGMKIKETKTVTFDNFAVVQWSYNVENVLNPNSTLRFEIQTKLNEFSFGWNR